MSTDAVTEQINPGAVPGRRDRGTVMAMQFKKATKAQAKLRLALMGPAGAGKTMSALWISSRAS